MVTAEGTSYLSPFAGPILLPALFARTLLDHLRCLRDIDSAVLMIALGAGALVPRFEMSFAMAPGRAGNCAERFGGSTGNGLAGPFGMVSC